MEKGFGLRVLEKKKDGERVSVVLSGMVVCERERE